MPNPRLIPLSGDGPEDVACLPSGELITGCADGRILKIDPMSQRWQVLCCTGGRPLGIEVINPDRLLICDAVRGLLQLDLPSGRLQVLVDQFGGEPLRFCNNATVAQDGTIYFSQSSQRHSLNAWRRDLVDHLPSGRLFKRTPDGEVILLADQLFFTNGVTLTADQQSLIYAQSGHASLTRLWLGGAKSGTHEPFTVPLAGFPDNLSTDQYGLIWVALASKPDWRLHLIHHLPRVLRQWIGRIQQHLPIEPESIVWAQAYNSQGELVQQIRLTHPQFKMVTGLRRHGHQLYLSSLVGSHLLQVDCSIAP